MVATTLTRPPARTIPVRPTAKPQKTFTIETWDGNATGEKIILYAESGMGKTTLASMAPDPVFIGLDDGGRKIRNPITGEELRFIPNVRDFDDVRGALNACLTLDCKTVVVDTITVLEEFGIKHVVVNVPVMRSGGKAEKAINIMSYGWNEGFRHLYDSMRLILLDCDKLIVAGKNVILIAQGTNHRIANPAGLDYLCDGPRLYNGKPSVLSLYVEWADHVLRIAYQQVSADKTKKATGDTTRVIFTKPEIYFMAKSRTVEENPISFTTKSDDSIWTFVFGNKYGS
jgi:hypothetical protein